jgi:hypothetical protein
MLAITNTRFAPAKIWADAGVSAVAGIEAHHRIEYGVAGERPGVQLERRHRIAARMVIGHVHGVRAAIEESDDSGVQLAGDQFPVFLVARCGDGHYLGRDVKYSGHTLRVRIHENLLRLGGLRNRRRRRR